MYDLIGDRIKYHRKLKKITQKDFAKRIGVNTPTYAHYENNRRKLPISLLGKIAKELNITVEDLLDDDSMPDESKIERNYSFLEKYYADNPWDWKAEDYFVTLTLRNNLSMDEISQINMFRHDILDLRDKNIDLPFNEYAFFKSFEEYIESNLMIDSLSRDLIYKKFEETKNYIRFIMQDYNDNKQVMYDLNRTPMTKDEILKNSKK